MTHYILYYINITTLGGINMKENKHSIVFGVTKEEQPKDYHSLEVNLQLNVSGANTDAKISFATERGTPRGPFDMERESIRYSISIDEARVLANKLKELVIDAEQFLSKKE